MQQYLALLSNVLENGDEKSDRTGVGTISLFGPQMEFDLSKGFPLLTTKRLHTKSIIHELLWMLSGDTNIRMLNENGVSIWDEWADENGDLGPVYGKQWREWSSSREKIDQILLLMNSLKNNPDSRRHIVSAWNVGFVSQMALPPCHTLFQCYISNGKLSLKLYQRSADLFLGVPFNIASYALLTHMIAQQINCEPGRFIWTGGDVHIYKNHIEQAKQQITREPRGLPKLAIKKTPKDIFSYKYDDFSILNYDPHPHIKGDVAV